jgi:nucleotide-binding universal stress UspA family protein/hemerythrin-like domain-containing protein
VYQHLLVPIDETTVSAANVAAAIALAKALSARITFFHATLDWNATEQGALMGTLEPATFSEDAFGGTNALLTKAVAGAKAAGILAAGAARVSDRPAEAIIEAALALDCDLIVMASRGPRGGLVGWLYSSQTERVLRRAPVALLVTRVATSDPLPSVELAIGIIEDEHRSIAVVVQGMREIVARSREATTAPDLMSLERMLTYLDEFPERVHHPKEERHLHRLLRIRYPGSDVMLREVESQHVQEQEYAERVSVCLKNVAVGSEVSSQPLADAVSSLADLVLNHIGFEERAVLPLAREHLIAADWDEIAQAFSENDDPRFGDLPADEFRRLFTRIANTVVNPG